MATVCSRSLALQIQANDLLMQENPSLIQYSLPRVVSRSHEGSRVQFVEWLRLNAAYFKNNGAQSLLQKSDGTVCNTIQKYAFLAAQPGFRLGTLISAGWESTRDWA